MNKLAIMKVFDKAMGHWLRLFAKKRSTPYPKTVKRILVIKLAAMGDAFCLMPSLRYLKHHRPDVEIHWLTTTRTLPDLFESLTFVDKQLIMPTRPWALFRFIQNTSWQQYDLIVDFDQYYHLSEWLALKGYACGFHSPIKGQYFDRSLEYDAQANEKQQFLQLIQTSLDLSPPASKTWLLMPELAQQSHLTQAEIALMAPVNDAIVIYPGSSLNAAIRRWDVSKYIELIEALSARGETIIIAGGKDELNLVDQFKTGPSMIWIEKLSLFAWSWFFAHKAKLFISNDGGLLHVAQAQGLKCLSLFGPTSSEKWGSTDGQSVSIEVPLECRPCIKTYLGIVPSTCARGDLACMQRIEVADVLSELKS